jgi:glycosyltransferase involved in cell wall biosynthesis
VGRVVPYKGLDRLLHATLRLLDAGLPVELVVVEGHHTQHAHRDASFDLRNATSKRELSDRGALRVVSHASDVSPLYLAADVLVAPNRVVPHDKVPAEAWGRVVEEALFERLPVISTSAVPSALEHVRNDVNGWLIPWDSDETLFAALRDVLVSGSVGTTLTLDPQRR